MENVLALRISESPMMAGQGAQFCAGLLTFAETSLPGCFGYRAPPEGCTPIAPKRNAIEGLQLKT
jgi:hypothetical protein